VTVAEIGPETHRRLAADLFNRVWELLEMPVRTREQDDEMVHAAHASRYHWGVEEAAEVGAVRADAPPVGGLSTLTQVARDRGRRQGSIRMESRMARCSARS
jgi:hypothetical protein